MVDILAQAGVAMLNAALVEALAAIGCAFLVSVVVAALALSVALVATEHLYGPMDDEQSERTAGDGHE